MLFWPSGVLHGANCMLGIILYYKEEIYFPKNKGNDQILNYNADIN